MNGRYTIAHFQRVETRSRGLTSKRFLGRSAIGRTITQADNIHFSLLTNNSNEIHFNAHYAARTEFKRPLVNSFLTLATVAGMMVPETSRWGFALGVGEVTLPNPLFEGDTLYADTEVLEARASRSRPG